MDMEAQPSRSARFRVPADLDNVGPVAEALRVFIARHLAEDDCNAIELAVTEALTNVARHGYPGLSAGMVELSFEQSAAAATVEFTLELIDSGLPIPEASLEQAGGDIFAFDPDDLESLPQGGMGLAIIKELFDEVHYESAGGVNRLTLAKRFPAAGAEATAQ